MAVEGDLSKENGDIFYAGDVTALLNVDGANFNDNAQAIFALDYLGFDSKLANIGIPSLDNVFYSTFQTDDATIANGFLYDETNDKYDMFDGVESEYVIIEADDTLISRSDLEGSALYKISSGKWIIFGSGTAAEARAQIHKALWYGTDGTNPVISEFSNVTALKTSDSGDVDRMGFFYYDTQFSASSYFKVTSIFTFDTSVGNDVSSWSKCFNNTSNDETFWKVNGVVKNSGNSDEIGTDTTADDTTAGVSVGVTNEQTAGQTSTVWGIFIAKESGIPSGGFDILTDFTVDESIPVMTLAGSLSSEGFSTVFSSLIYEEVQRENITNVIPVVNSLFLVPNSNPISEPGFETIINWTGTGFGTQDQITDPYIGTYAYELLFTGNSASAASQVEQTGIDFSSSEAFSFWFKTNSDNSFERATISINGEVLVTYNMNEESSSYTNKIIIIPRHLRIADVTLTIKYFVISGSSTSGHYIHFDDFITYDIEDPDLEFSNDGSTYESCINRKIHRPTTTGTKAYLKIISPTNASAFSYITEYAQKYNLY